MLTGRVLRRAGGSRRRPLALPRRRRGRSRPRARAGRQGRRGRADDDVRRPAGAPPHRRGRAARGLPARVAHGRGRVELRGRAGPDARVPRGPRAHASPHRRRTRDDRGGPRRRRPAPGPRRRARDHAHRRLPGAGSRRERGLRFEGYDDLYAWSVDDLDAFWQSIWDFFEVRSHSPHTAALADATMPGAVWFPGATLNYAEHAVGAWRDPDGIALIERSQTREPRETTRGELADQVARARAGPEAPRRRRRATGSSATCPTSARRPSPTSRR